MRGWQMGVCSWNNASCIQSIAEDVAYLRHTPLSHPYTSYLLFLSPRFGPQKGCLDSTVHSYRQSNPLHFTGPRSEGSSTIHEIDGSTLTRPLLIQRGVSPTSNGAAGRRMPPADGQGRQYRGAVDDDGATRGNVDDVGTPGCTPGSTPTKSEANNG